MNKDKVLEVAQATFHFKCFPRNLASTNSWMTYFQQRHYFLGYSYGISMAFVVYSFQKYQEQKYCGAKTLMIGSLGFSGFLGIASCFLIGCCGSPMLVVYLSFLGTQFLSFTKPLIAIISSVLISAGWLWIVYRSKVDAAQLVSIPVKQENCDCDRDC